ncbi:hypothetical protein ACWS7L_07445 [Exiguobacterium artemiae]
MWQRKQVRPEEFWNAPYNVKLFLMASEQIVMEAEEEEQEE